MTNKPMLSVERDSIALEAMKAARQFIVNGIELGFISMPEPETPDPAHDTLPMIDRAIAELKAAQHQGEPVAHTMKTVMQAYENAQALHLSGTSNFCAVMAKHLNKYAGQPAPVAMVMPERKCPSEYRDSSYTQTCMAGEYNRALAEVSRLNVVKP